MSWRVRLWRLRQRFSLCRFRVVIVWPDMPPVDPRHRAVRVYTCNESHLTPVGAWRAARAWDER